jgi:4-diphosphocytidyl-2-C-methyl-D-erythritol kinase
MSGSGPTVFTLVDTLAEAEAIAQQLKVKIPNPDLGVWTARFVPTGVQLVP